MVAVSRHVGVGSVAAKRDALKRSHPVQSLGRKIPGDGQAVEDEAQATAREKEKASPENPGEAKKEAKELEGDFAEVDSV